MTAETTVLHGALPSAHGNTASPTPRGGDEKLDSASLASSSRHRRDSRREHDKDDASRRGHSSRLSSSSFPYRDIIKSVLSHVMTKTETPSSQGDMKDKQVEDVVRGLAMEEWNSRWLDELVAKVKGELNDGADHGDDGSVSDDGSATQSSTASSKDTMKRYQPTVEDYNEDEDEPSDFEYGFTPTISLDDTQPLTRTSSQLSNSSADSSCSTPSNSSADSSISKDSLPTPPSSVSSESPTPRPTVRFAEKQPPVIHYTPEPPEPEPELEPEPEPYHSHSSASHLRPPAAERQGPSWTLLFNERDEPTPALGRFLRGLANHIIAEYSPTDSLVITPDKLLKFYSRYKLDNEFFPFQRVFDTRYHKSLRGLSFLFSDLRCEHHLVQSSIDSKPSIPALTPAGFEDWMTLMVRAFPDREAKRLDLVLADIPLLADDRHARLPSAQRLLPRELPRELFPERGHVRVFDLLASSFAEWNTITAVVVPPEAVASSHPQLHSQLHAYSPSLPSSLQKLPRSKQGPQRRHPPPQRRLLHRPDPPAPFLPDIPIFPRIPHLLLFNHLIRTARRKAPARPAIFRFLLIIILFLL
ncbi:hypothetical protein TrVFT333_006119 [Trichoderma virens FT-333]|nr:hypothetical protein TrVFT333_006119 [Trichoderma virens FT-333]